MDAILFTDLREALRNEKDSFLRHFESGGRSSMRLKLNKSSFLPGETAVCLMEALPAGTVDVSFCLFHLTDPVIMGNIPVQSQLKLKLPDRDFTGYLLQGTAYDQSNYASETAYAGLDCSSTWTKFPRYGYLWDYTHGTSASDIIDNLSRFHLNGLQFYDWQYRHHIPVAPDLSEWTDWSGRVISGSVVRAYLEEAHKKGMVGMAYNMIYAANMTYLDDGSGVSPEWRLVKENGDDFTCDMDANLGKVGILQYFNPLNPDWQKYIFKKENEVFAAFPFDGWHGDTIGEMGIMKTADGSPLGYNANGDPIRTVKDSYTLFLNAAKEAIGNHYLVFNPVGAQGVDNVNISNADILYTEFWPWDLDDRGKPYQDYYSIHRAILRAQRQSGKSLVVAAYINYKNPSEYFNPPAVRLMDSVVFASGGSRIELGNGDGMLSNEYFPDDRHKKMDPDLSVTVQRMYDFIVAYENLLRNGQESIDCRVEIADIPVSYDGQPNRIWCFGKKDHEYKIYHFINLCGTDHEWRDTDQTKNEPSELKDLITSIHIPNAVQKIWLVSPDREDISPQSIPFDLTAADDGYCLQFKMPFLSYWNMVFMR